MNPRLKPLKDQVFVITGASSGIGLVTARMAAKRGARVVLTARNYHALRQAAEARLRRAAEEAVSRFGRIDAWVNGAGVSLCGASDQRRPCGRKRQDHGDDGPFRPPAYGQDDDLSFRDAVERSARRGPDQPQPLRSYNGLKERGGRATHVSETSLYTQASLHPILAGAALAATGLPFASWLRRRSQCGSKEAGDHRWYQADTGRR